LRIDEIADPAHAGAPRRDPRPADRGRRLRRTDARRERPSTAIRTNSSPQTIAAPTAMTIVVRRARDVWPRVLCKNAPIAVCSSGVNCRVAYSGYIVGK